MEFLSKIADNLPILDMFGESQQHQMQSEEEYRYYEQIEEAEAGGYAQEEFGRDDNFDESIFSQHLKHKLTAVFKQDEGKKILLIDKRLKGQFDMAIGVKPIGKEVKPTNLFEEFKEETGIEKVGFLTSNVNTLKM